MLSTKQVLRFGQFEVDLEGRLLLKNGFRIKLAEQSYQLLMVLLERPGEVITREELRQRLWPSDVVIDFDHGLNKSVQKLREALGDSAERCNFIETRQRVGYRFIAPVQGATMQEPLKHETIVELAVAGEEKPWQRFQTVFVIAAAILWLAGIGAWLVVRHSRTVARPIRSLAVLPLENLSGDPNQDYFVDGMTDELITELAHIPNLRVVSRTSIVQARREHKSLPELARELEVEAVVEGSVVRSADKVRINAQLIEAASDKHLWAQSFESQTSDLVSLQDSVAREIAAQTQAALAAPLPITHETHLNPAAHDAYLRGRYFLSKREADKSTGYFQEAIRLDPEYASAYAGLADSLESQRLLSMTRTDDHMPSGLIAARRAITLNPQNGEAYTSLGGIETTYEWNWAAAEQDLTRGIALSPSYSMAEMYYSVYLDVMNRTEEAVAHMRRALQLDPLSFFMNRHLGSTLYFARHYDEALFHLQRAAEIEPKSSVVENWVTWIYENEGNKDQAVAHDLAYLRTRTPQAEVDRLRTTYEVQGWNAYWHARMVAIDPDSENGCGAYMLGVDSLLVGERDQAFRWLNRALDRRCFWMVWMKANPTFDALRQDERYALLLRRMNLPL
jgi:TolB-like protein/DNA-binding winged helix-turn-helix (wHTH) protein/Tfp pilus assembly protein PilF